LYIKKERNYFLKTQPLISIVKNMQHLAKIRLNGRTEICPDTLIFCEGESNYSNLYFADSKMITVPKTLKKVLLEMEGFAFVRIHKKYFINLKYLKKRDGEYLTMANDTFFTIARRRQATLTKAMRVNGL
jgi:two-component system, LytTR family, response regulator